MASTPSKRRTKSGVLPGRFKNFVNDMKRFKLHRRGKKKSEGDMAEPTSAPEIPQATEPNPISSRSSLPLQNLAAQVTITFDEPLNYSYTRNYETSPSLQATEALCQGLLRRVDHCCHELITRKDSTAMEYAAASGSDKPLRFEIQIDILQGWSEVWASRTFKSYQKQHLSAEAAREIIISTHQIIGLFLRRHDQGFVWKDGPVRDDPLDEQCKYPHRAGRVEPMSCVPRSYFLEKSQSFETVPGYSINLSFTSRCQRRKPSEWHTTAEVNSSQTTPLNSIVAESLFFEASYALEGVLRSERQAFETVHRPCANLDGCKDCRHHDGDGLELQFSIANNLGPQFPRLDRTIHCNSSLSLHSDAHECLNFVKKVETAFAKVRDDTDNIINVMNDLEFRIIELRGFGWSLDEPLVFILDSSSSHSQRNTEAVLDRIQAGVADILRGNAISVRMTAHKRGHFILDKTFVARDPFEPAKNRKMKLPRKSKDYVLNRLRQRIERDIEIACRDTLTLDDNEETGKAGNGIYVSDQRPSTQDADITASTTSGLETTESASDDSTEEQEESSYSSADPETSATPSVSKKTIPVEGATPESPAAKPETAGIEHSAPSSPVRPPIPARRSSVAILCSNTGARAFPLVPGLNEYKDSNSSVLDKDESMSRQVLTDQSIHESSPRQSSAPISSEPTSLDESKESEEKVSGAITDPEEEQESAPVYEPSTSSSAPSLMSGGGSSPSSSILITPKATRLRSEVDYSRNVIVDSDEENDGDSESTSVETQQDLAKIQPFSSPTLRHATKLIVSSPLRKSETVQEQGNFGSINTNISSPQDIASPHPVQKELAPAAEIVQARAPTASVADIHPVDASTSDSSSKETRDSGAEETGPDGQNIKDTTTKLPSGDDISEVPSSSKQSLLSESESESEPGNGDADDFAQSKPDFIFSSPATTTPDGASEEEDADTDADANADGTPPSRLRAASPDPSEAFDSDASPATSPRVRKALGSPRRSFGSAGMLGFHEQMFGSLNLRTALMRSRPTSYSYFTDVARDEKRPGTAM
ncbi:hypothetical protein GGR54DRAFT_280173 [Hypoxylon sp. NC1633]|nr:hypothetical protein GGR54DRAFT_280173 [Hypoxylon sp. NC1633]